MNDILETICDLTEVFSHLSDERGNSQKRKKKKKNSDEPVSLTRLEPPFPEYRCSGLSYSAS
jgi:hypothetical protein